MKYLTAMALVGGFALSACNNNDLAYVPLYVPTPEYDEDSMSCAFSSTSDPAIDIRLDVSQDRILDMLTVVENRLDPVTVELGGMNSGQNIKIPRTITPLRFDFRWECESTGFQGGVGPIYLPAFTSSIDSPFCLDTRSNVTGKIEGFDVVPASGEPVGPGEQGLVKFTPVPAQLGQAFYDFFRVAELSQACCDEVGGDCDDVASGSGAQCTALQQAFDALAGPSQLSSKLPGDVQRYRGFSTFVNSGAAYPMRMSGFIEGVMPNGDLITSSRFIRQIELCGGGCKDGGPATRCLARSFVPPTSGP